MPRLLEERPEAPKALLSFRKSIFKVSRFLLDVDLIDNLSVTSMGLRDTHRTVMLFVSFDCPVRTTEVSST